MSRSKTYDDFLMNREEKMSSSSNIEVLMAPTTASAVLKTVEKCCVRGCKKNTSKNKKLSFHTCSSLHSALKDRWLQSLQMHSFPSNSMICSAHFEDWQFVPTTPLNEDKTIRVLRRNAIPLRNLPSQPKNYITKTNLSSNYVNTVISGSNDVKSFCRCCLKLDPHSTNMKNCEIILDGNKINLFQAFFDCTGFKVLKIDDQAQICEQCVENLEQTIVFLTKCQTSNSLLTDLFDSSTGVKVLQDNVIEDNGINNKEDDCIDIENDDTKTKHLEDLEDDNDDENGLLVPMHTEYDILRDVASFSQLTEPVAMEPIKTKPVKIIKTEVIDIDYEDVIAQIPTSTTIDNATHNSKKTAVSTKLPNTKIIDTSFVTRKRGRPKKKFITPTISNEESARTSTNAKQNSETNTAAERKHGSLKRKRNKNETNEGDTTDKPKRKYNKWVYLSPKAPLDPSEQLTGPKKQHPYACSDCDKTFKLQVLLRYHEKTFHSKVVKPKKIEKQLAPSLVSKDPLETATVAEEVTRILKRVCEKCGKNFENETDFKQHKHYTKKARLECALCPATFLRLSRINFHILKAHHWDLRQYKAKYWCTNCKSFMSHIADDFYKHLKTCKPIAVTTKQQSNGGVKMKQVNGPKDSKDNSKNVIKIPPNVFFCNKCETGYLDKHYFDVHLTECYGKTELYQKCCLCNLDVHLIDCNFMWPNHTNYKKHMMEDHHIKYRPEVHGPQSSVRQSMDDGEFFGF